MFLDETETLGEIVMTEKDDPLRGFFERMRPFVRSAVEGTHPGSAISLHALRKTKPELAKRIFIEAVLEPIKALFGKDIPSEVLERLEEIESKFRQESIVDLLYEAELLVAARLTSKWFLAHSGEYERLTLEPVNDKQGYLTPGGAQLLGWITNDVTRTVAKLAALRERRVQLLLATAMAGTEAMEEAVERVTSDKHGAVMQAVWGMLLCQNFKSDESRRRLADQIAGRSDERIEALRERLEGCAFMREETVRRIVDEIFTGEEYIEF